VHWETFALQSCACNGFVQHANGSLRTLSGQFAGLNRPVHVEMDGDSSGLEHAVERASESLRGGDREGRRLSGTLGHLGSAAGVLGSVASKAGLIGAKPWVRRPLRRPASRPHLAAIAPAAGIGATAVFALAQAQARSRSARRVLARPSARPGSPRALPRGAKAAASAQQSLSDAVKAAARANEQAAKQVATAEQGLADAQREARAAQMALNDAREQGARDLEDINDRLADAELSQRDAVLDVADAELELAKARASGDPKAITRAQLAYDRAVQRLKEQTTETGRLRKETARPTRGRRGSDAVRQAQERIADTQRTVGDRERDLADARKDAARTAADGLEQVRRAQQALADGAGGGGVDAFAEAMAKLSPAAREFVTALLALKPAWDGLRLDVQQTLMQGLAGELTRTAGSVLPVLRRGLVDSAGALNLMGRGVLDAARNLADSGTLGRAMASASAGLRNLSRAPGQVVTGLGQVAAAAGPCVRAADGGRGQGLGRSVCADGLSVRERPHADGHRPGHRPDRPALRRLRERRVDLRQHPRADGDVRRRLHRRPPGHHEVDGGRLRDTGRAERPEGDLRDDVRPRQDRRAAPRRRAPGHRPCFRRAGPASPSVDQGAG
jgi:uncharacterized protein YukE